ncbi:MAG TPA: hypothetical protein VI035_06450 [Solirubrobacterales bacterium]
MLALATAVLAPADARGTVTIGSNLNRVPTVFTGCDPSCTRVPASLTPGALAAGGLSSPVNGMVVTWRIRVGSASAPVTFRVVRRFPGDLATGAGTSATVMPPVQSITAFPVRLPIAIRDSIGVDCCVGGGGAIGVSGGSGTTDFWLPALADGAAPRARFQFGPQDMFETAINADIEPTSAFTISAIKLGKGGKVTVTATLPNPGTLTGGDKRDPSLAAAAGKGKGKGKQRYLKRSTMPVGVAGQTIRLLVRPTKRARALVKEKGSLKAKLKVVFTPTGGNPTTQVLKVRLKR